MSRSARTAIHAALLAAAACLVSGCAETIRSRPSPALAEREEPIRRIAVAPFEVRLSRHPGSASSGEGVAPAAAAQVAHQVAEALSGAGFEVVPPEDVSRALVEGGVPFSKARPGPALAVLERAFGVDAVLFGEIWRFRERVGSAAGATRPASVGFGIRLVDPATGQLLYEAVFDETQRPVSENVLNAARYPGGGSRWLTAAELSGWGARELAQELARELPRGS